MEKGKDLLHETFGNELCSLFDIHTPGCFIKALPHSKVANDFIENMLIAFTTSFTQYFDNYINKNKELNSLVGTFKINTLDGKPTIELESSSYITDLLDDSNNKDKDWFLENTDETFSDYNKSFLEIFNNQLKQTWLILNIEQDTEDTMAAIVLNYLFCSIIKCSANSSVAIENHGKYYVDNSNNPPKLVFVENA